MNKNLINLGDLKSSKQSPSDDNYNLSASKYCNNPPLNSGHPSSIGDQDTSRKTPSVKLCKAPRLTGKVALITGATRGIGLATALLFLEHGANIAITGVDVSRLNETKDILEKLNVCVIADFDTVRVSPTDLQKGGYALVLQSDAGITKNIDHLINQIKKVFGVLDVIVPTAAIIKPAPIEDIDEDSFDDIINVNLKGAFFTIQKAIPILTENSSVIVITSISNKRCAPPFAIYAASKAALSMLVKALSIALAPKTRVNAISPGFIPPGSMRISGLTDEQIKEKEQQLISRTTLQRAGQPNEIANVILFLASTESSYINGVELEVDGGASVNI